MQRSTISSLVGVGVAILASQHHLIHMAILWIGLGSAGISAMSVFPWVRRALFALSLLFVGISFLVMRRHSQRPWLRWLNIGSSIMTIGLLAWSIMQTGW